MILPASPLLAGFNLSVSFSIDRPSGRLIGADWIASPNCNERPSDEISLLVIHNISLPPGQFNTQAVERFFCNELDCSEHPYYQQIEGLEVSAHLLIERTGRVVQFVPFNKRAWHAGQSSFDGREQCNDFSIGIELEGSDDQPFTDQQYDQLVQITEQLLTHYPLITPHRITGHSDIAPGRKTDPGPCFDWDRYLNTLGSLPAN
ncbi:1,6-anhydro-N-acetylmuramyl-L-alanine amidase AmpD [Marinobacterium sp. xm-g-59]|nr:1,6-anhydro-N-acetylmuramyl-L-alanine amidase AmpD [Marinobacterium sp. xm-g-59]